MLKYDTRVSYLSRAFYHYDQCINDNSICQSYSKDLYEYDKKIYSKFCNLLKESSAYEVAELNMGFVILSRAFWGEIFSSKDFKKEFANYLPYVMKKSSGLCKWCMYLSCKGFYRPTMFIYKCFISIRRIGRKFLKAIKKE